MKSKRLAIALTMLFGCLRLLAASVLVESFALGRDRLSIAAWSTDIDFAVDQIIKTHPNPFMRTSRDGFYASVSRLKSELPKLSDDEISVRLMQIVASIRDGHTSLFPASGTDGEMWFPVRYYQFADGLFITAIDKQYAKLAGAKVGKIGDKSAAEALALAQSAFSADNQFAALQAPILLSSVRMLRGLHVLAEGDRVSLQVITRENENVTIQLTAVKSKSGFDFQYFGEMFGPVDNLVTAFGGRSPGDFLDPDANSALALHLRGRRAFWYTYLAKKKYGTLSWWQPFDRAKLNAEGYRLIGQGRKDDGITAFLIVVDRFPDLWEPWDSLAEGYMNTGSYPEAIAAYKKALHLNANNWNAGFEKKSIEKMESEMRKNR